MLIQFLYVLFCGYYLNFIQIVDKIEPKNEAAVNNSLDMDFVSNIWILIENCS